MYSSSTLKSIWHKDYKTNIKIFFVLIYTRTIKNINSENSFICKLYIFLINCLSHCVSCDTMFHKDWTFHWIHVETFQFIRPTKDQTYLWSGQLFLGYIIILLIYTYLISAPAQTKILLQKGQQESSLFYFTQGA